MTGGARGAMFAFAVAAEGVASWVGGNLMLFVMPLNPNEVLVNDFCFELMIAATPSAVFAALTTQEGLRGWWTQTCDAGAGVGSTVTLRFGPTYKVMKILCSRPDSEVHWRCLDSQIHVPGINKKDEWKGTEIRFSLAAVPGGTRLRLDHFGLHPQIECYEVCANGWRQFLGSLRAYLENGRGMPYVVPAV